MMVTQKPVAYPNLQQSITDVVDAYEAVHDAVSTHAEEHHDKLEQRRKTRQLQLAAKKLLETKAES